jgi:cellobiose phosphorylase
VPSEWKEFSAVRKYRGTTYAISFENPNGKNKGVKDIFVDGMKIQGNILPLKKKQYDVRVVMG